MISIPRVSIPDSRELEEVLNEFAYNIERALNKKIHVGRDLVVTEDESAWNIDHNLVITSDDSGGSSTNPWTMALSPGVDSTHQNLSIWPGTLCGLCPDNIMTPISVDITDTDPLYIFAKGTSDGKQLTELTMEADSSLPVATGFTTSGVVPTNLYVMIGIIVQGTIYQIENQNLEYIPVVAFVQSATGTILPGHEPFVRWWRWQRVTGQPFSS